MMEFFFDRLSKLITSGCRKSFASNGNISMPLSLEKLEDRSVPAIVAASGQLLRINPPATAEVNKLENASNAYVFAEKANILLSAPLKVDVSVPGIFSTASTLTPTAIQSGTPINSYYLHGDVLGQPSVLKSMKGSITFDQPVIGLILSDRGLSGSDFLSASKTVYSASGRAFDYNDLSNPDGVMLSQDRKTITFDLKMAPASDDMRIITAAYAMAPGVVPNWYVGATGVKLAGQVELVNSPLTVEVNKNEDPDYAKLFVERTGVILTAPLAVDAVRPGIINQARVLAPGLIQAGTMVNSYYLHADVTGQPVNGRQMKGSITFEAPVIGLIFSDSRLAGSNFLGLATTKYPNMNQAFDVSPDGDMISLSQDRKTVYFNSFTAPCSDDIRILTAGSAAQPINEHATYVVTPGVVLSGQIETVPAPRTVEVNKNEDPLYAKFFAEKTSVTLTSPLGLDVSRPGTYNLISMVTPGMLQAGTAVSSYYLHADVTGTPSAFRQITGSITFEAPVLGLIFSNSRLNASNYLGSPSTIYSNGFRQFEVGINPNDDSVSLSADRKTVSFNSFTSPACDDLRIITAAGSSVANIQAVYVSSPGTVLTGQVGSVLPPKTVEVNKNEDPDYAQFFLEQSGITLGNSLNIDVSTSGQYTLMSALSPSVIAAGTKVNSYYLHADVTGQPVNFRLMKGAITFETPILGLIFSHANLNLSNHLGASGTIYSSNDRHFDIGSGGVYDSIVLSSDRKTVYFNSNTAPACDDMRIITAAKTVALAPTNVVASAKNNQVNITWNGPRFDGYSSIINYIVEYSRDGGKNWTTVVRQPSIIGSATITGLQAATPYVFRIAAINLIGKGIYSNPIIATIA